MDDIFDLRKFSDVPISDPFFDSLKNDYKEFPQWYAGKANKEEKAYVQYSDKKLTGFMYIKTEEGPIGDIYPPLPKAKYVKIGTLKVEAHGTRLGERFIKKAFDYAITNLTDYVYVTVFARHKPLINMLEEFGFVLKTNTKTTVNGTENVFIKDFTHSSLIGDLRKDYPFMDTKKANFYLLSIQPQWHSQLFPDSLLKTENYNLLSDISRTNSISKIYVCSMEGVDQIKQGDLIVIYRTKAKDDPGAAEYRSVATSVCVVEQLKEKRDFVNVGEYLSYVKSYSVFNESELKNWWKNQKLYIIKMLYNAACTKRLIRKVLADDVGLNRNVYWGFMKLSREQFLKITEVGGINERLVIR